MTQATMNGDLNNDIISSPQHVKSDPDLFLMRNDEELTSTDGSDHESTPFEELIDDIKRILGPSSGINTADVDTASLMGTLKQYVSKRSDWQHFAFEDNTIAYTRNGVDTINSKANLLVLVWTPGKGSAVHDHANAHCIVKILQGSLRETLYHPPISSSDDALKVRRVTDFYENDVSYMSDTLGLHKMANIGEIPAVSLHLYTPPFAAKFGCNIYEKNGVKHHVSMSNLYSNKGVRFTHSANTC